MIKTRVILLALLTAALPAIAGATRPATKQPAASAQEAKPSRKQREHSKLYKNYRRGQKLTALAAAADEDIKIVEGVPNRIFRQDSPRLNFPAYINRLACGADAVVTGVIISKTSQLTEDEDFIFTDYEMSVEDVLKGNPASPIRPDAPITITRPGGTVRLSGRNVSALDETLKPLDVGGRYLLFLNFVPATGAYKAAVSSGSFELKDDKTIKLTEESLPAGLETRGDARAFVANVRHAITGACVD